MTTFHMKAGPNRGRSTVDIEQYLRWLKELTTVSPELEQSLRDTDRTYREGDAAADEAAARFAPEED